MSSKLIPRQAGFMHARRLPQTQSLCRAGPRYDLDFFLAFGHSPVVNWTTTAFAPM